MSKCTATAEHEYLTKSEQMSPEYQWQMDRWLQSVQACAMDARQGRNDEMFWVSKLINSKCTLHCHAWKPRSIISIIPASPTLDKAVTHLPVSSHQSKVVSAGSCMVPASLQLLLLCVEEHGFSHLNKFNYVAGTSKWATAVYWGHPHKSF